MNLLDRLGLMDSGFGKTVKPLRVRRRIISPIFRVAGRLPRMNRFLKTRRIALALALGFSLSASAASVTNLFGFSGKEIYPIDQQIGNLRAADLDGDGLNDLIVANNLRSKINLLYNLTP